MRGTYLRVGLLVLGAVGLLVAAVLLLGGNQIQHGQTYETYFGNSVQGLDVGAPVKYRGVTIGAVTQIALVSAVYGQGQPSEVRDAKFRAVLVRYQIDVRRMGFTPGQALIDQGLRARTAPQGLTGVSYVDLDFSDPERYPPTELFWKPRYPYIPSMPSTLTQVKDAATELLNKMQQVDINGLATSVQALISQVHGELGDGGDAHGMIVQATATLGAVQAALKGADVPALAAELHQTLAATRSLAQGPQTRALLRSATEATQRLAQATVQLPQLLASLDAVARRANAGSADLEAGLVPILRDARTAAAALRETSEALRRDPSQVVLGGPPPHRLGR